MQLYITDTLFHITFITEVLWTSLVINIGTLENECKIEVAWENAVYAGSVTNIPIEVKSTIYILDLLPVAYKCCIIRYVIEEPNY